MKNDKTGENQSLNSFGKLSHLRLCAAVQNGKTYLEQLSFTAPYKVMVPFTCAEDRIRVMPLLASAGLMEGDCQEIMIETKQGAGLECVSQAFDKIHRMEKGEAFRHTSIRVGKDSMLVYRPLPVIPFAGSAFRSVTRIQLEAQTSCLIYQEILSCGRYAAGEKFRYRYYYGLLEAWQGDQMVYRENCRFCPEFWSMEGIGMFEGYTHMANLLLFHISLKAEQENEIWSYIEETKGICGGITRTAAGDTVIRIFGNRAQNLLYVCDRICMACDRKT